MARIRMYFRAGGLLFLLVLLLAACTAAPVEPTTPSEPTESTESTQTPGYDVGYPVMSLPEEFPAIDWAAIPVGTATEAVLPTLGIEETVDTSPTEGADSLFDTERLAPMAEYTLWPAEASEALPEAVAAQLQVQLMGIPLDHLSIFCRGGIVHYVAYHFHAEDASDPAPFHTAVEQWVAALQTALADEATWDGTGSLTEAVYRVYFTGANWQLELEVLDGTRAQLRLRSPITEP